MTARSRKLSGAEENSSYENPQRGPEDAIPCENKTENQTDPISRALDTVSLWLEEEKNHRFLHC